MKEVIALGIRYANVIILNRHNKPRNRQVGESHRDSTGRVEMLDWTVGRAHKPSGPHHNKARLGLQRLDDVPHSRCYLHVEYHHPLEERDDHLGHEGVEKERQSEAR